MKSPIIHTGTPFDWGEGNKFSQMVMREDGEVNWGAAFMADPGVMFCPKCKEHLWNEGDDVECPVCHHRWLVERRMRGSK